jgi:hypothetical protein
MAVSNKNQHWVPQFYLRGFVAAADLANGRNQLWAFPVDEGNPFKTAPRNVAAKAFLYTITEGRPGRTNEARGLMDKLEDAVGGRWQEIVEKGAVMDTAVRQTVALLLANLYQRHPSNQDV